LRSDLNNDFADFDIFFTSNAVKTSREFRNEEKHGNQTDFLRFCWVLKDDKL
jgi:hypothetical protein